MIELLGWTCSVILLLTITRQIYTQWESGSSKGVSIWLFVGQLAASLGFTIYSFLIENWVFVATNALMTLAAIAGIIMVFHHRNTKT